ncbi:helix-turn-helix domain-containing protein [Agromyces luteolus]|uniref:Helix-turn-helix domain-containing protein n=1 Tax=Agromyces luteolus TaxID=88373 RepID=A0A7C9HHA6_9MICO|nr:helix-turn-helix domain-containing protein [Agromyces luteolus]
MTIRWSVVCSPSWRGWVSRYIGLAEITAMTSIPKPTVRRIAEDLVRRGKLERTPLGYGLGSLRSLGPPLPQYELDHRTESFADRFTSSMDGWKLLSPRRV